MKRFTYISLVAGLILAFQTTAYLSAQEYDDLYYEPAESSKEESGKKVEEPERLKSDYELYREQLEEESIKDFFRRCVIDPNGRTVIYRGQ